MKRKFKQWREIRQTVIGQLSLAILSVFVTMTILSNLLINAVQTYLTNRMIASFQATMTEKEETLIWVDASTIQSMWEFRLFSVCIVCVTILLGSLILYYWIKRIMKPFKELANTVANIHVENLPDYQKELEMVGTTREMTQLTLAFNEALGQLYQSYNRERRFSNDVAHELRLPLAIMRSKIDLYKKHPKETQQFVATMDESVERLSSLVEGILLFIRQDAVTLSEVSMKELLEEIVFDLEEMAEQKNVTMDLSGDDALLVTDDQLLARALYNLLENAIKYNNPDGQVTIEIRDLPEQVELWISDTGIGIQDADKKHIFELFYRVDDSRNSAVKGYGIGLSLVAKIMQELGGTIHVINNYPQGTVFHLILSKSN